MNAFNALLTWFTDLLLAPLAASPLTTLLLISAIAGVLMTVVFRYASRQSALRAAAERTQALVLSMRLFKDDIRVALRCQAELMVAIGLRLWYSLPPMVILIVPFFLLLSQLALRFEHQPLQIGEACVAEVQVAAEAWPTWRKATIEPPAGIRIETPALRDELEHALYWRLRVERSPTEPLRWRCGVDVVEKELVGAADPLPLRMVSVRRSGSGIGEQLLHPGEPTLPDGSPVRAIVLHYPRRATPVLGVDLPWWATFMIASMATALLVRPIVGVQF